MKKNLIRNKSFDYALEIIGLYKSLQNIKREFIMSKQLLRSGTSVGAMVREAEHAESKADFIHKLSIAQKEINENIYWLELLYSAEYLSKPEYDSTHQNAVEILKILSSILITSKSNIKKRK